MISASNGIQWNWMERRNWDDHCWSWWDPPKKMYFVIAKCQKVVDMFIIFMCCLEEIRVKHMKSAMEEAAHELETEQHSSAVCYHSQCFTILDLLQCNRLVFSRFDKLQIHIVLCSANLFISWCILSPIRSFSIWSPLNICWVLLTIRHSRTVSKRLSCLRTCPVIVFFFLIFTEADPFSHILARMFFLLLCKWQCYF